MGLGAGAGYHAVMSGARRLTNPIVTGSFTHNVRNGVASDPLCLRGTQGCRSGVLMDRYFVNAVRIGGGVHTDEGAYTTKEEAIARLVSLADDQDCLLAEVELFVVGGPIIATQIVAQSVRKDGKWVQVNNELHSRSRSGEAEALVRAAREAA
jgi:hypothetical protein